MTQQQSPARRPERNRLRTGLLGAVTSILVAFGGAVALPAAAHADEGTVAEATLEWGVKATFRNYIYNFAAFEGKSTQLGTATQPVEKGEYRWGGGTGTAQEDGSAANVSFGKGNGVHFQSHPMTSNGERVYALDIKFTNPRVVVTGAKTGELRMDVVGREFHSMTEAGAMYTLENASLAKLTLPDPKIENGTVTFTGAGASLTQEGSKAFGGFYKAGEVLDPVTFTLPVKKAVAPPTETKTTIAASPASPAVLGSEVSLAATVEPATATGSVQFFDGDQALGAPVAVAEGKAQLRTTELAAGGHAFRADFTPEGNFAASKSEPTAHFGVVDPAAPAACTPAKGAETLTGVTANWAYSDYSNAPGHAGSTYQMSKFASGNIAVNDKDFVLSKGTALVSKDCTAVSFTGTMRVEAYQSNTPPNGFWTELVDPVLSLDATGAGTWTAGVRSGGGELNSDVAPRTVVAVVGKGAAPDFSADTVSASVNFAYEGAIAAGSWVSGHNSAWANGFVLRLPSEIRPFYYASGAKADAKKPAAPLRLNWKWDTSNASASVQVDGKQAAEVQRGQKLVFSAGPFARNSEVAVEVRSEPVSLGKVATDAQGLARAEWTVPADFALGAHSVVFIDAAGKRVEASFKVLAAETVAPDKKGPVVTVPGGGDRTQKKAAAVLPKAQAAKGKLAKTGADDPSAPLLWGVAALVIGAGIMLRRQAQRQR